MSKSVAPVLCWFNEAFFYRICKSIISDKEFKIGSFSVLPITNDGGDINNLASPIYRASVRIISKLTDKNEFSFIFKLPSASRTLTGEDNEFENEIRFYSTTLEDMHRILEISGEKARLGPRVIYYSSEPDPIIVLEDLAVQQSFAVPLSPLNLDSTISVIFKLAKWHAASIFLAKNKSNMAQYNLGFINKRYGESLTFFTENFQYFVQEIQNWDGYGLYANKFNQLQQHFLRRGQEIFAPSKGINVLNHGGLSLKNILINRNNEKIGVNFIDFRHCIWATPAIDLLFVLHLVVGSDVLTLHRTDLINFYYNELALTLRNMGFLGSPPSLMDLQLELLENGFLEVILSTCVLPFSKPAYRDGFVGHNAEDLAELRRIVYTNEEYRSVVKSQLPYFLSKGYLN